MFRFSSQQIPIEEVIEEQMPQPALEPTDYGWGRAISPAPLTKREKMQKSKKKGNLLSSS
jgi:hypothetical protein